MPLYYGGSTINGTGIFCTKAIKSGDYVLSPRRILITREQLKEYSNPNNAIQVHPNLYLAPSDFLESCINHSCAPNAGFRIEIIKNEVKSVDLFAIDDIPANKEITFDYSSTQLDDDWSMNCLCGAKNCRGLIANCSTLTFSNVWRYWSKNVLPNYALRWWIR
jgi:hypothetical protein